MPPDRRPVIVLLSAILVVVVGLTALIAYSFSKDGQPAGSSGLIHPVPSVEATPFATQASASGVLPLASHTVEETTSPEPGVSPTAITSQRTQDHTPEPMVPRPTESETPTPTEEPAVRATPSSVPAATQSPTPDPILVPALSWQRSAVPSDEVLQEMVSNMTLGDKLAQMLMVGFRGQSIASSPELSTMVGDYHVGGLVLLESNAHDPRQVHAMTTELQTLATSSGAGIPLFFSINHEGGIVVRITEGVTAFPGNMAVAATSSSDNAYRAAAVAAFELRAMGINMNLAPVLDVNDNPLNPIIGTRSFGDSPELTAEYGKLTVRGFQQAGVIAVAKHFPGHGGVAVDSHGALPVIEASAQELAQHELVPFKAAIEEGVEAIMTAHIAVPALDATGRPATLSPEILTGLLRGQLNYQGLIMTDSLGMAGVTAGRGQVGAALEAVLAGADILLSTSPMDKHIAIIQALQAAVEQGDIPVERIDRSVVRILRVKYAYGLFDQAPAPDLNLVGSPVHQGLARQIALEAVTLLRDTNAIVPLPAPPQRLLLVSPRQLTKASSGKGTALAELLRTRGYDVGEQIFDLDSEQSRSNVYSASMAQAALYDAVIFGEWELVKRYINSGQTWQERLIRDLQQQNANLVVVAWHNPAAILRCPQVSTFLTAYGDTQAQIEAVVATLVGDSVPAGTLPLSLSEGQGG